MNNPKFEVQHFTLCDGWINTWHEYDDDNNEVPMIFDTFGDALLELDNFLADEIKAYNMGDIESPYDINEFRIVELQEWELEQEQEQEDEDETPHEFATTGSFTIEEGLKNENFYECDITKYEITK